MSHIVSRVQHSFVFQMSQHLSGLGSLRDSAADPHSHYQSCPILAHELEEVTYDFDDLHQGSIVEWAGKRHPPPPCTSICDLRIALECTAARGWSTRLWEGLKRAVPRILALRLIPGRRRWKVLWGLWGGKGRVSPGRVCARCTLWTILSPSPWDVTWSPFRIWTLLKRRTTPPFPFDGRSYSPTGEMILPSPPPTHGLPLSTPFLDLTTPTLYTTTLQAWYRGLVLPHPFITATPPLRTSPLPDPPSPLCRPLPPLVRK